MFTPIHVYVHIHLHISTDTPVQLLSMYRRSTQRVLFKSCLKNLFTMAVLGELHCTVYLSLSGLLQRLVLATNSLLNTVNSFGGMSRIAMDCPGM